MWSGREGGGKGWKGVKEVDEKGGGVWRRWRERLEGCERGGGKGWRGVKEVERKAGGVWRRWRERLEGCGGGG